MISSPYFTASGRQTRSATRAAADALGKKKKPARKHVKIEYESENQDGGRERASDDLKEDVASKKRKKDTSVTKKQSSDWEPANWREQLANIREMRKLRDAPVDSQGCEKTADMNQSAEVSLGQLVGWEWIIATRESRLGLLRERDRKREAWHGLCQPPLMFIESDSTTSTLSSEPGGYSLI